MDAPRVVIGRIARPHGIRGALRVELYNIQSHILADRPGLFIAGAEYALSSARPAGGGAWLVTLVGISTPESAEALRGQALSVERSAVDLAPGEYLVSDFVGYRVFDDAKRELGVVEKTFHQGAHEVLVLSTGEMIPLVPAWLAAIDEAGRVLVLTGSPFAPPATSSEEPSGSP